MVNKMLLKETKNFIKKNIKTYIAQVIIIMLGVGFFIGMKVSTIDLSSSMSEFINKNNFYDLKVNLEYGVEESDIKKLADELKDVKYVEGAYSVDLISTLNEEEYVIRLHSYNKDKNINEIKIKDGTFPEKETDCVIDYKLRDLGYEIGDEIEIDYEYLKNKKMTITGIVQSPEYLAVDRGNSQLISGKINYYIYANEDNIDSNVYTDLYIKFNTEKQPFTELYDNYIELKEIESYYIINGYYKDKYNEIISEQQMQLVEANAEYEAEKAKIDSQFVDAENEIKNKENLLKDAKKNLLTDEQIRQKVNSAFSGGNAEIAGEVADLKKQVDQAKRELDNYKSNYNNQIANTNAKIQANNNKINELNNSINEKEQLLAVKKSQYNAMSDYISGETTYADCYPGFYLNQDKTKCCYMGWYYCYDVVTNQSAPSINNQKVALKKEIDSLESEISQLKVQKNSYETENANLQRSLSANNELAKYENKYNNLKKEYESKKVLYDSVSDTSALTNFYQNQNNETRKLIRKYESEITDAKNDLAIKKSYAYQGLNEAKVEIENGEDMIKLLTYPTSYMSNRLDNSGYGQFKSDIDKINNLAIIIPSVFYFITFFMISASITRMLHEERNQIGTLKALGVRDKEIIAKYLIYSISSVVVGSILGMLIGLVILPLFVYFIYEMLYEFPSYSLKFNVTYLLVATLIAFVVAIVSTIVSCRNTFSEKPVDLLKTKQEKEVKKSFLEKVPFIWNHLTLTTKMSLKNIFKYKTRMLMTIIGIGGCLALMLTGLSLRTSITEMIPTQYGKIFKVDAQIFYKDIVSRENIIEGTNKILNIEQVESGILSNYQTFTADYNNKTLNVNVVTLFDNNYSDYIELNDYKTHKKLAPSSEGVLISEKFAELMNVEVGQIVKILDKDQKEHALIVDGIVETYIEHYVYMNAEYYEKVFNQTPRSNMLLLKIQDGFSEIDLAKEINSSNIVSQILYMSLAQKAYEDVMNNLALLVGLFIVFSILLVFAVLYNLININVRERSKEIAVYKVLGFKNKKVISVIKRENIVLMFIGVILGLIAGYIMSLVVIESCEVENLNFIKEITMENCIISVISTIFFTLVFSMIINKYVKCINLTESLKSNE